MGVPALFRWLSNKYPRIITPVIEEQPKEVDGQQIPVDMAGPNPNGEEMDNLYLDMNGIVHPCSHPEDRPPPATEAEMMLEIFKYMERVIKMVRPRKVLMLAVDGVAPRAKMNQQRSRRFRSAQEAREKDEEKAEFVKLLKSQNGGILPDNLMQESEKRAWDTNVITPGTPFMDTLAIALRYWTAYKLNTDPAWENLKIIISDATVPGEGEHKIMEFIRAQRSSPEHDPNTRHVMCGLDADLIMLGLATHEPHFRVLREDVFAQDSKPRTCRICGQPGHFADQCKGEVKKKQGEFDEKGTTPEQKPWIWLHVSTLREYLAIEMDVPNQGFKFDLERALDDWVFMCFFVGNDFLPHLPSLDIREQGIDTLIAIWRDNIPVMGGYVTKDGHVNLDRAQLILSGLAKQEDAIFQRRRQEEERKEERDRAKKRRLNGSDRHNNYSNGGPPPKHAGDSVKLSSSDLNLMDLSTLRDNTKSYRDVTVPGSGASASSITHDMVMNKSSAVQNANQANKSAAAVLKEKLAGKLSNDAPETNPTEQEATVTDTTPEDALTTAVNKRKRELMEEDENGTPGKTTPDPQVTHTAAAEANAEPVDEVRLWESGYGDRYYEQKFNVDPKDHEFRQKVGRAYTEGLAWVLLYYFQGCPSWTWYYPYHYAPFAADFVDIGKMELKFDKGIPFRPFEQLMGVLPAASNHAIPEPFRDLMTNEDSDIVDFYPETFPVDLNGKKWAWQGVALLPFIDEKRLLDAMATKYPLLSEEEHRRNEMGTDILFFSDRHPMYEPIAANFFSKKQGVEKLGLTPRVTGGLSGMVEKNDDYIPGGSLKFPLDEGNLPDLDEDHSMSVYYEFPKSDNIHKSMILRGAKFPDKILTPEEEQVTRGRAARSGRSYGGVPFRGDGHRGRGNSRGGGRGGQSNGSFNYGGPPGKYQQPPQQPGQFDPRPNPFGAHLNPAFFPNGVPPPPLPTANGWAPPPFQGGGGPPHMPPMPPMPQGQQPSQRGYGYNGYQSRDRYQPPDRNYQTDRYQPPPHSYGQQGSRGGNRGGGGRGGAGYGNGNGYGRGREYRNR